MEAKCPTDVAMTSKAAVTAMADTLIAESEK